MSHLPVNHPLRPAYRATAALTGGYLLAFGIIGAAHTTENALVSQTGLTLGARATRQPCVGDRTGRRRDRARPRGDRGP